MLLNLPFSAHDNLLHLIPMSSQSARSLVLVIGASYHECVVSHLSRSEYRKEDPAITPDHLFMHAEETVFTECGYHGLADSHSQSARWGCIYVSSSLTSKQALRAENSIGRDECNLQIGVHELSIDETLCNFLWSDMKWYSRAEDSDANRTRSLGQVAHPLLPWPLESLHSIYILCIHFIIVESLNIIHHRFLNPECVQVDILGRRFRNIWRFWRSWPL